MSTVAVDFGDAVLKAHLLQAVQWIHRLVRSDHDPLEVEETFSLVDFLEMLGVESLAPPDKEESRLEEARREVARLALAQCRRYIAEARRKANIGA